MSWVVEYILGFHNWWNKVNAVKRDVLREKTAALSASTSSSAQQGSPLLRIGILSAAAINYTAIWDPVSTHPGVVITGVAARDKRRAEAQIASNSRFLPSKTACKAYGSYAALLDADDVDAVYIPLPNGLHHEWALKALQRGKHVLVEKPIASNAQQTREIRDAAARAGKVVLEAFHWRFHPSAHVVKQLLLSGEHGRVLSVDARAVIPGGVIKKDDIRFKYGLAGGCCMDLTYVFSAAAYFAARDVAHPDLTFEVLEAKARLNQSDPLVDEAVSTTLRIKDPNPYPSAGTSTTTTTATTTATGTGTGSASSPAAPAEIHATLTADLSQPKLLGLIPKLWAAGTPTVTIQCERAEIVYENFMGPWLSHKIAVVPVTRDPATRGIVKRGKQTILKQFSGGPLWDNREFRDDEGGAGKDWWTTYRWQLEAFVSMVRRGESGYHGPWVDMAESVRVMEMIDATYEKLGLPLRGV
ncbi:uncharacterized protein Z520_05343 [Fonsecaea multimorphosa CBS 102226]|uniref:D-xylose 1-dehydrogenase (NADP(+), D-xylono-1,5-lactone-forming) n=1 Tax=Fonsecaea multimorphosa CBS 102226 TaxID=1442371 RepID=A0A0D2JZE4_9EURO|nr:uncharacterized protein Z520_05343 [Fonsecaea multimorphosa CBS 102226]KIX98882.1 hypothetical protein Z520_05343 [Fonsecaea multimorphosa CBS 102226]OAL25158.1 hypothetical protein AYO22_05035 [Fonsecaea multimorphosa]